MKKILISLDRIKNPNSGLGKVSIDFYNEISKRGDFEYTFLVPKGYEKIIPKTSNTITLTLWRRIFSGYMKRFDLVHILHQLPSYSLSGAKKLLLTIHDLNFLYTKNATKREKYRRKLESNTQQATALAFISKFTQNDCLKNISTAGGKPSMVIYNGSAPLTVPSPKPDWCPDSPFLFSVGIFSQKKNFHTLIPFLKSLPTRYNLIIAGNSSTGYGLEIKNLIKENNLEQQVCLPGMITEAEKSYLYHNCEALLVPSIAEGFGLPVIEAMSIGKPVFCSDKTSLKEIGSDFAYFWTSFTPDEMGKVFTTGMQDFKQHPERKESQIKYANTYTWEENVTKYVQFYNDILNNFND